MERHDCCTRQQQWPPLTLRRRSSRADDHDDNADDDDDDDYDGKEIQPPQGKGEGEASGERRRMSLVEQEAEEAIEQVRLALSPPRWATDRPRLSPSRSGDGGGDGDGYDEFGGSQAIAAGLGYGPSPGEYSNGPEKRCVEERRQKEQAPVLREAETARLARLLEECTRELQDDEEVAASLLHRGGRGEDDGGATAAHLTPETSEGGSSFR